MLSYLIKKILSLFITLFFVVSITFVLMKAIPGDPFTDEKSLSKEMHTTLLNHYGLNDPWYKQYFTFVTSAFTFNLGPSLKYHNRSVNSIIEQTFPVSATLGLEALILALGIGISLGVIAALKQNRLADQSVLIIATIGISIPSFILATFLQYTLSMQLGWFPLARWGTFWQTILPSLSLALMPIAYITRLVRANLIEVLKSDYIKTAYSKGLTTSQILYRHALKNALTPLVPYFGQLFASILFGSFIIEKIFSIPGLGQWFVNSVSNRDYTLIMATTLFYSFILLVFIFLADLIHMWLDPRLRGTK